MTIEAARPRSRGRADKVLAPSCTPTFHQLHSSQAVSMCLARELAGVRMPEVCGAKRAL